MFTWLLNKLTDQSGQLEMIAQFLPAILQAAGGLGGLFAGEPRGAAEAGSMQRRAARQEALDIGQQRSIRDALLQRAQQAAFGISPAQAELQALRGGQNLLSGKAFGQTGQRIEELQQEIGAGPTGMFTPEQLGPFRTRLLPSEREALEGQFGQARAELGQTGMRGGRLQRGLADLSIERARKISGEEIGTAERGRQLALALLQGQAIPGASVTLPGLISAQAQQQKARQEGISGLAGAFSQAFGRAFPQKQQPLEINIGASEDLKKLLGQR